jgi:hypothetical protein
MDHEGDSMVCKTIKIVGIAEIGMNTAPATIK